MTRQAAKEQTTHLPKRRRGRKDLWFGLFIVLAVVGGRWVWRQVESSRLREPLIQAVKAGNAEQVRVLLEQGANPDVRVGDTTEPFSWASVLKILHGKYSVAAAQGDTVLMDAAGGNRVDIVRLLLEHGANVQLTDSSEHQITALEVAANVGAYESMEALIAHGADVNAIDAEDNTPLLSAITGDELGEFNVSHRKRESCVELLLQHGADANLRTDDDKTPLMTTARACQLPALRCLLAHGADVNAANAVGVTALMYAMYGADSAVVAELLRHGARIDAKDNDDETALMHAILEIENQRGSHSSRSYVPKGIACIQLLLANGADVQLKNNKGQTALLLAESLHDPRLTALLRKAAARASGAGKGAGN